MYLLQWGKRISSLVNYKVPPHNASLVHFACRQPSLCPPLPVLMHRLPASVLGDAANGAAAPPDPVLFAPKKQPWLMVYGWYRMVKDGE
eukprot:COSAG01_NODE_503_length_16167_cov_10.407230_9_plen_89_part_00